MYSWITKILVNSISLFSGANKIVVLTYHRVGESYNQLSMNEYLFEQHLIWLKKYFNPVSLDEGLSLQKQGRLPPRAVAITIDDGYVDSYKTIFPLLKKHQVKATFFISTSGLKKGFLWDELIYAAIFKSNADMIKLTFEGVSFPLTTYNERLKCSKSIINMIKYCSLSDRERLIELLLIQTGKPELSHQFISEEQIVLLHRAGMGIGAHTVNHPILTCEEEDVAKYEILESKQRLEQILQASVKYFAYPNGKNNIDFNVNHQKLVASYKFDAAFSTDWGCVESLSNPYKLKRFTPWDIKEAKFNLRLALNFSSLYSRLFN